MMNKEVLYHGSPIQNLRQLIPATGQNNCVYLTPYYPISALFCARFDDLRLSVNIIDRKIHLVERLPDMLNKIFLHKSGSIYRIEIDKNQYELTHWRGEVIVYQWEA